MKLKEGDKFVYEGGEYEFTDEFGRVQEVIALYYDDSGLRVKSVFLDNGNYNDFGYESIYMRRCNLTNFKGCIEEIVYDNGIPMIWDDKQI